MGYNSAEDLVNGSQTPQIKLVRLAEVTSLDSKGRAKVKFYGEDTEAGKTYNYIDGYIPEIGDKVLMLGQGNTYIIMGAVEEKEVIVKYALKGHDHGNEYVLKETYSNHTHTNIKNGTKTLELNNSGDVVPGTGSSCSLGTQSKPFAKGYIENAIVTYLTIGGEKLEKNDLISKMIAPTNPDYFVRLDLTNLIPHKTKVISLGTAALMYNNVYAQNIYLNGSAISSSDKRKKKFIRNLAEKYLELFAKLRPVTFKYKKGTSGRAHVGFIAQEVEQAMRDCGITNEEFGGLVIQDNGEYGIRYEEFIALQTAVIQNLQKRLEEVERRVKV